MDDHYVSEMTPYDDAFRAIVTDCPRLTVSFINYVFGTDYTDEELPVFANNEYFITGRHGMQKEIITDSTFMIRGSRYHLECQALEDGTMQVRMSEYDVQIALGDSVLDKGNHVHVMRLPNSSVLYLRSTSSTPDEMENVYCVPDHCRCEGNNEIRYFTPAIKLSHISLDEIVEKRLFLLIPFQLFKFESELDRCEEDDVEMGRLLEKLEVIYEKMYECYIHGMLTAFELAALFDMADKVNRNLAGKQKYVRERIGDFMGGVVAKYPSKEIYDDGVEYGSNKRGFYAFKACIQENLPVDQAQRISKLSDEQVKIALKELGL